MLDFALTDAYAPFTTAFMLMCGIGLLEAVGLGLGTLGADAHVDLHGHDVDADGGSALSWLGMSEDMPLLIWLTSLLACYTLSGFVLQQACEAFVGAPMAWPVAAGAAVPGALLLNVLAANVLHRIMPRTETTAIGPDDMVGLRGVVLDAPAARGRPSRAKVVDRFGQAHHVPVEPHEDRPIPAGASVLLVRREDRLFFALQDDPEFPPV